MCPKLTRLLTIAVICSGAWAVASCQVPAPESLQTQAAERRATRVWIERPWTMRYFIAVTQRWPTIRKVATEFNAKQKPGQALGWQEIFEPVAAIPIANPPAPGLDRLSVVVVEFDEQGKVTTPHSHGGLLRGRLSRLQYITLSSGDGQLDAQYDLGHWFTGLGEVSTDWAPGLCGLKESPSPFSKTDIYYLYGPKFQLNEYSATFGCREWAYQLYDGERPYIDVTSYLREGVVYPKYTAIGDFIGWARFGDKKPVIGQHSGRWYCLHDCPNGDKPGLIVDIKSWAARSGWSVPKPPSKAPTFPDPPAAQGTYPG